MSRQKTGQERARLHSGARELQASEAEYREAVYTASAETRESNVLAALRAHAAGGTYASEWHDAYEVYLALVHKKRQARRKVASDGQ